ncbi:MAG: hypothetical protein R3174_06575 [Gammaproteobacteria bacterium]|nr:hypothetical protein [Gammaproteobacteria bacterium]
MPNGHGGFIRFGSPVLIFVILVALYFNAELRATDWYRPALLALSAMFGWKLSLHLHMWKALEYGGAYLTEAEHRRARIRFAVGVVCYSAVAALAVWLLTA